jgi:hypothetical protein
MARSRRSPEESRRTNRAFDTSDSTTGGGGSSSSSTSSSYTVLTAGGDYTAAVPTKPVTGASNTTPILVTVVDHQLHTGEYCTLRNIGGNTAANGTWEVDSRTNRITVTTKASGSDPIIVTTAARHGYSTGDEIRVQGVRGMTGANSTTANPSWTITVITDFTFSLNGSETASSTAYDTDGIASCSWADKFFIYQLVPHTTAITGATNASPIVLHAVAHGLVDNTYVIVLGVQGNTAANNDVNTDTWQILVVDADHVSLTGSTGNGAYTSGGTITPAFENYLDGVVGNGAYTSGGTMIVPGQITINATTAALAETRGFQVGGAIRMTSVEGGTTYGVITSLPGLEGYPYQRPAPVLPLTPANTLRFAGAPLLGDLTSLAVGSTNNVREITLSADHYPHWGSQSQLPISQLVQGSPATLQPKWRAFGGGNVLGEYGKKYEHYYYSPGYLVAFSVAQRNAGNTDLNPLGLFSGGTVTIVPDHQRPMNTNGVHTDGSTKFGALVTKTTNFSVGHPVTGLKGWTFRKMDVGASTAFTVTAATNASPIVVTTSIAHTFTNGSIVSVQNVVGNTAANGTWRVASAGATTIALTYLDDTNSTGNGVWTSGGTVNGTILETTTVCDGGTGTDLQTRIEATSLATPVVVTATGHGLSTGTKIWVFDVNDGANGLWSLTKITDDTFSLDSSVGTAATTWTGYYTHGLSSASTSITSSTNATPIVVTKASHGLNDGDIVFISGHTTNTSANGLRYVDKLSSSTFALYYDSNLLSQVAGVGVGGATGSFVSYGKQVVVESLTMSMSAGGRYEIEDLAQQPFVNVDLGGQLVSRANGQRGVRASMRESHLVYASPVDYNFQSVDCVYNTRLELACMGIGNRPGQRIPDDLDTFEDASAPQYVSAFLIFVLV